MKPIPAKDKRALEAFQNLCSAIHKATPAPTMESEKQKRIRIERAKNDYDFFFPYYFPHYAKCKNAKVHNELAEALKADPLFKGILEAHRGFAKSVHADIGYAVFLMINDLMKCMLLVGQTEKKAFRLLSSLQAELMKNQRIINDFGEQFAFGNWSEGEFVTKQGVAFYALGLGQSPNGTRSNEFRPDYIVCDDLDSKERCKNPKRVGEAVDWIMEDLMGCFDIGNERFLLVNSRIAKDSILARLHDQMVKKKKKGDRWWHRQVNALDRKGNPTWPDKYSKVYWMKKKASLTLRAWSANYMNNPIVEGKTFKEKWIKWRPMLPLNKYEHLLVYCDPSLKDTPTSDHKAISFWGKVGTQLHKIKHFNRQTSIATMVRWFYDLYESMPEDVVVEYWMEANFFQDLLLDDFSEEGEIRGYELPLRKDMRSKPDKHSRIESTSGLYERGAIYYNIEEKDDPDYDTGKQQLLAFEKGSSAPDDGPDADEGAIWMLQRRGRVKNTPLPVLGKRALPKNGY